MSKRFRENTHELSCEDTVDCSFFSSSFENDINYWKQLCKQINITVKSLSQDFLWHRDEFVVYFPVLEENQNTVYYLKSSTCFGDNVEDEWFVVYLIIEITKRYQNLIVQIHDNDGDFLLIEAADYLPSWANPESTENRIFLHNGHIHLIPPDLVSLESELELNDALKIIVQSTKRTRASMEIENAIHSRVGSYPEKVKTLLHTTVAKLPLEIATILSIKPALIAPVVNAYCNYDVIDAKLCKDISLKDCVNVNVKFTKCLYAMLLHAKLINSKYTANLIKDKRLAVGFKLTCGFQMIMNSAKDISLTKKYKTFLNNLKNNGYFKENIEGSKGYKELLAKAEEHFAAIESPVSSYIAKNILELLSSEEFSKLKDQIQSNSEKDLFEENEDWLNINPEELNKTLNKCYRNKAKCNFPNVLSPEAVSKELNSFLHKTSDFEGIETNISSEFENQNIEFDADEFSHCVEKFLNLLADKDYSDVSDDDFDFNGDDELDDNGNAMDIELNMKLDSSNKQDLNDEKSVLSNIIQSMKEEKASTGPSSNLLSTVGINKEDLLDSDDDEY